MASLIFENAAFYTAKTIPSWGKLYSKIYTMVVELKAGPVRERQESVGRRSALKAWRGTTRGLLGIASGTELRFRGQNLEWYIVYNASCVGIGGKGNHHF